jgi:hypothetical protein
VIDRGPVVDYLNGGTAVGWLNTIDNILKFDSTRSFRVMVR